MKFKRVKKFSKLLCFFSFFALAATVSLVPAYSQTIVADGMTNTNVAVNGNKTTVTTSTIINNNAFNSFKKFNVNVGDVADVIVPGSANHLINIVHSEQSKIDGYLNFFKNNKIDGNIFFVNPHGVTVGAQGTINAGMLTVVTPTQQFTNGFFTAPGKVSEAALNDLVSGKAPINPNASFNNDGVVNSGHKTNIVAGSVISYGDLNSCAEFDYTNPSKIVNLNTIDKGVNMVNQNGEVSIVAENDITVYGDIVANQKLDYNVDLHSKAGNVVVFNNMVGKVNALADKGDVAIIQMHDDLNIYKIKAENNAFVAAMKSIKDVNDKKINTPTLVLEEENIKANDIRLMSFTGSAGDHSEDLNIISNHKGAGGIVSAWAPDGHIFLDQRKGDMLVDYMFTEKDLSISCEGSILDANKNSDTNIYASNIALTSYSGKIGEISSPSVVANPLEIESNIMNSGGVVYAHALKGEVNLKHNAGDMKIQHIYSGNYVELNSEGSILAESCNKGNIVSDYVHLTSINGNIGELNNMIDMNSSNNNYALVSAYAKGDIALNETKGHMQVGEIKAGQEVKLVADGSLNNGFFQTGFSMIEGSNIELISKNGEVGNHNMAAPLNVNIKHNISGGGLTVEAAGDIYIESWEDLWLNTVRTQGDVHLTSGKNIFTNMPSEINIEGADISLYACKSIGTKADPLKVLTTTGNINAISGINDVNIYKYVQLNFPSPPNPFAGPEPIDLKNIQLIPKP